MTHRQARRKLGSRKTRRSGTKTKVIPGGTGGANARPPKYRFFRPRPISNAAKVAKLVRASMGS